MPLDPIDLEPSPGLTPVAEDRPFMPEPPPVRLVSVADVTLPAAAGQEPALDAFYAGLLQFDRDLSADAPVYIAENFRLVFEMGEGLVERDDFRPVQIVVKSLEQVELKLLNQKIEYTRQRALAPGIERLVLKDPAGNWIELHEVRLI